MGRYSERCAQAKIESTQKELTPKEKEELEKKQRREKLAKVAMIMRKCETLRTPDETRFLEQCSDSVKKIIDRKERREIYKERVQEKEDPVAVIEAKARKLAEAIRRAKHLICYTGAGISTSAKIPDYRGSNGIWTLLAQGKSIGQHDLSLAEPTFTHMALFELHRRKMLKFVVSQNCDGLHLRSGLPRYSLSEVHGNMYVEACKDCKPNVEYWRLFDTTELTARYNHKTNRRCYACSSPLVDTIVHFGERGSLKWPLNWAGACKQSEETDTILCLGSSLKVLKKYSWLWAMDRPVKKRPKLLIVNLQWTPKDSVAALKVNGKCDDVMRLVMQYLDIEVPAYRRERDPIFVHASMLRPEELHTVSQPMLKAAMEKGGNEEKEGSSSTKDKRSETGIEDTDRFSEGIRGSIEEGSSSGSASDSETVMAPRRDENLVHDEFNGQIKEEPESNDEEPEKNLPEIDVMDLQKRLNRFEQVFKTECEKDFERESLPPIKNTLDSSEGLVSHHIMNGIVKMEDPDFPKDHPDSRINQEPLEEISMDSSQDRHQIPFPTNSNPRSPSQCHHETPNSLQVPENEAKPPINASPGHSNSEDSKPEINCDKDRESRIESQLDENETKLKISEAIKTLYKFSPSPPHRELTSPSKINEDQKEPPHLTSLMSSGIFSTSLSIAATSISSGSTTSAHYQELLRIYKSLESTLPHWNNPKYAYSGLHSIILPPPPELNLWGSVMIPIIQPKREKCRPPPPPECSFCFENYSELVCQFYEPKRPEFQKPTEKNGKIVVCECCDHSEEEEDEGEEEDDQETQAEVEEGKEGVKSEKGGVNGVSKIRGTEDVTNNRRRKSNELNEISNNLHRNGDESDAGNGPAEKVPKLQNGGDQKENGTGKVVVVQAGWYGKGYRKFRSRRRKS